MQILLQLAQILNFKVLTGKSIMKKIKKQNVVIIKIL